MAITNYYVDPSIAGDSGTGTIGDPYGDLQYALNNITRNATSGDQINVKAGTDEVLAAALTLATYGTPAEAAPLVIRGYTSAANDGGIGGISGAGTYGMFTSAYSSVHVIDMHCHNCGSAAVINLGSISSVIGCEVDNSTGDGISLGLWSKIVGCYVHNIGGAGANAGGRGGAVFGCYFENGTNDFGSAIVAGESNTIAYNIVKVDGGTIGINISNDINLIFNNSLWSNGGGNIGGSTGTGIHCGIDATNILVNNIVEGWSGTSGEGIDYNGAPVISFGNVLYNNTTNEANTSDNIITDNNTLGASPFVNAASGDFDINGTVANVTEAAWPQSWPGLTTSTTPLPDVGAVQAGAGAGGSSVYRRVARLLGG